MMPEQFEKIATPLDDVFLLKKRRFEDDRGLFIKTFSQTQFREMGLSEDFKESIYSISRKNVLRGCHYQRYPYGHAKLVNVIEGEILDVIVGIGGQLNTRNRGGYSLPCSLKKTIYPCTFPTVTPTAFLC